MVGAQLHESPIGSSLRRGSATAEAMLATQEYEDDNSTPHDRPLWQEPTETMRNEGMNTGTPTPLNPHPKQRPKPTGASTGHKRKAAALAEVPPLCPLHGSAMMRGAREAGLTGAWHCQDCGQQARQRIQTTPQEGEGLPGRGETVNQVEEVDLTEASQDSAPETTESPNEDPQCDTHGPTMRKDGITDNGKQRWRCEVCECIVKLCMYTPPRTTALGADGARDADQADTTTPPLCTTHGVTMFCYHQDAQQRWCCPILQCQEGTQENEQAGTSTPDAGTHETMPPPASTEGQFQTPVWPGVNSPLTPTTPETSPTRSSPVTSPQTDDIPGLSSSDSKWWHNYAKREFGDDSYKLLWEVPQASRNKVVSRIKRDYVTAAVPGRMVRKILGESLPGPTSAAASTTSVTPTATQQTPGELIVQARPPQAWWCDAVRFRRPGWNKFVMGALSGKMQRLVRTVQGDVQDYILWAAVCYRSQAGNLDDAVRRAVMGWRSLGENTHTDKQTFMIPRELTGDLGGKKGWVPLVVVSVATGIGVPILALQKALMHCQAVMPCVQFDVLGMISFEVDHDSHTICKQVLTYMGNPGFRLPENNSTGRTGRERIQPAGLFQRIPAEAMYSQLVMDHVTHGGDVSNFVNMVPELAAYVDKHKAYVLVLTGEACTNISCAQGISGQASRAGSGLHTGQSKMHWPSYAGQYWLAKRVGFARIAAIHEQVASADPEVENQLNTTYGPPLVAQGSDWGGAHRTRHLRTSPRLAKQGMHLKRWFAEELDPAATLLHRKWAQRGDGPDHGHPDVLRAYMPQLLRRLQQGQTLTAMERRSLNSWRVTDVRDHREHWPGREHWMHWMGLHNTVVGLALQETYPCLGVEDGRGTGGSEFPCGEEAYCRNCALVFRAIGSSWNLPMMEDAIAQTLVTASRFWVLGEGEPVFWAYQAPVHTCDINCTGYRELTAQLQNNAIRPAPRHIQ